MSLSPHSSITPLSSPSSSHRERPSPRSNQFQTDFLHHPLERHRSHLPPPSSHLIRCFPAHYSTGRHHHWVRG
ncbi:hypothetical protein AYX14_07116 [Cryptococcus neoformans]|nr:hypothetical protein AYX14_07116 [Cryptococcus neoformans var. grubii]